MEELKTTVEKLWEHMQVLIKSGVFFLSLASIHRKIQSCPGLVCYILGLKFTMHMFTVLILSIRTQI